MKHLNLLGLFTVAVLVGIGVWQAHLEAQPKVQQPVVTTKVPTLRGRVPVAGHPTLTSLEAALRFSHKMVADGFLTGDAKRVDIYLVGGFRFRTELEMNHANFNIVPMPPHRPQDALGLLGRSIEKAVDLGAEMIMAPGVDPRAIASSLQYAESSGVPVFMIGQATGVRDPAANPATGGAR